MKNNRLMVLATLASYGLLYVMIFNPIPDQNVQVFVFLLGLVCGFFFGGAIKQTPPQEVVSTSNVSQFKEVANEKPVPSPDSDS